MTTAQIILILIGLFTMAGGVFDWDWFLGRWRAQLCIKLLGRQGARIFYIILGLAVIGFAYFGLG